MTKLQQSERDAAIAELRETLKPGTTVYTVLRHVSRSGMSRDIDVYAMEDNEPRRITWSVAQATGIRYDRKAEALKVGGCGMDMGFHVVYNLSRALYDRGHSFTCIGKDCPSNDHANAYNTERQRRCMVCGKELPETAKRFHHKRRNRPDSDHLYEVCSEACATGEWVHSNGGYALKHRWM
jgi:hypothetical protein